MSLALVEYNHLLHQSARDTSSYSALCLIFSISDFHMKSDSGNFPFLLLFFNNFPVLSFNFFFILKKYLRTKKVEIVYPLY